MVQDNLEEVINMSDENNKLQISGNVHYLSGPISVPNNNNPSQPFTKSICVLNIPAGEKGKPQLVSLETFGNRSSCFAGLQMGSWITVDFNIRGRQGPNDPNTGTPRYYNTLSAWRVDPPPAQEQQPQQQQNNQGYQQQPAQQQQQPQQPQQQQQNNNGNQFPQNNQQQYFPNQNNQQQQQQNNQYNSQQRPAAPANTQAGAKRDMSADVPDGAYEAPPAMPSFDSDMADDIPF